MALSPSFSPQAASSESGGGFSFPSSRSAYWDRSPLRHPAFLKAANVIPSLFLSPSDIQSLLHAIGKSQPTNTDEIALCQAARVTTIEQQLHGSQLAFPIKTRMAEPPPAYIIGLTGTAKDLLLSNGNGGDDFSLTIPFQVKSDASLHFKPESTTNLVHNLVKTLRSSRQYSLKSCIRIRAAGVCGRSYDGYYSGTIRLEAIAPNVSFQAAQIRCIPLMGTPLSHVLLNRKNNHQNYTAACPRFGYWTLNQKRNLVPLLETDPAVSLCPVVGCWVCLDHNDDNVSSGSTAFKIDANSVDVRSIVENPYVWGACLRYQFTDKIRDRAYVSADTFLLVAFQGASPSFWEISMLPVPEPIPQNEYGPLLTAENFQCLDFTVDLSAEAPSPSSAAAMKRCMSPMSSPEAQAPVICRFRPLSTPDAILAFRSSTGSAGSSLSSPLTGMRSARELNEFDVARCLNPDAFLLSEEGKLTEAATPQPRGTAPSPTVASSASSTHFHHHLRQTTASNNRIGITAAVPSPPRDVIGEDLSYFDDPVRHSISRDVSEMGSEFAAGSYSQGGLFSSLVEQAKHHIHLGNMNTRGADVTAPHQSKGSYFPAEVVLAQQVQIEEMRRQIDELKEVINMLINERNQPVVMTSIADGSGANKTVAIAVASSSSSSVDPLAIAAKSTTVSLIDASGKKATTKSIRRTAGSQHLIQISSPAEAIERRNNRSPIDPTEGLEGNDVHMLKTDIDGQEETTSAILRELALKRVGQVNPLDIGIDRLPALRANPGEEDMMETGIDYYRSLGGLSSFPTAGMARASEGGPIEDDIILSDTEIASVSHTAGFMTHSQNRTYDEVPSIYESESIMAIEAKYLNSR